MSNIHDTNFNKNVLEVYTEEPGFTGYKGLEWNKLDNIEDILQQGVVISGSLTDSAYISGIKHDTASIDSKLFITGDPYPAGVQGTIAFQADLTSQFDNVDISGTAGNNINDIKNLLHDGIRVYLTGINAINVDVTGGEITVSSTVDVHNHPTSAIYAVVVSGVTGVEISNFPTIQGISGNITGNVSVANFPAIQNVTGNITIISNPAQISTVQLGGNSSTAFGRLMIAQSNPMVQNYASRFNDPRVWQQTVFNSGTITFGSGMVVVSNGAANTNKSYGALRSRSVLSYQPGVSVDGKFTAIFSTPKTGTLQYIGYINNEEGLAFGYSGLNFGILHRYDGKQEVQKLTITNATAGGTRNATVNLNGYINTISISGSTTTGIAKELADTFTGYKDVYDIYKTYQLNNDVYFVRQVAEAITGTFTATGVGFTGVFTQFQSGKLPNEDWYIQTGWNIDKMNGSGVSAMNLNPQLMNVYNMKYGWLGAWPIQFGIGHENSQGFTPVHLIDWANKPEAVRPWANDPRFPLRIRAEKVKENSNNDIVTVKSSSCMGSTEGPITEFGPTFSLNSEGKTLTAGSAEQLILSVECSAIDTDIKSLNRRRLLFTQINVASYNSSSPPKSDTIKVRVWRGLPYNLKGAQFIADPHYKLIWYDTSASTIQFDSLFNVATFVVPANSSEKYTYVNPLPIEFGEVLIITAQNIGTNNTTVLASVNGSEDL